MSTVKKAATLDEIGRRTSWICVYCHRKTSPTVAENHGLRAQLVDHDGEKALAHLRCVERQKAAPIQQEEAAAPASVRGAMQALRDVAHMRAEMVNVGDLLDMADVPPEADVLQRVEFLVDEFLALRQEREAARRDDSMLIEMQGLRDKARRLETELAEKGQRVDELTDELRRAEERERRYLQTAETLGTFMSAFDALQRVARGG